MQWLPLDWSKIFLPDTPVLEIIARGSVMYLGLFCLLRLILTRQVGSLGLTDLLVIVLIADAAQNGMAAHYTSLIDGLLLVSTLIFWNFIMEWLGFHSPTFENFIHPQPLTLVQNGRMLKKNMQKELITEDDLMNQLRLEGVEKISQVKKACLEGDGKISVIKKEK